MSLQGIEVNKIVPVKEVEDAAPRSLLPLEQEAECAHTQLSAYQCPGDNRVTVVALTVSQSKQSFVMSRHSGATRSKWKLN